MKPFQLLLLLFGLLLAACGNNGSSNRQTNLFTEPNAWKGTIPPGAEIVTPDEFQKAIDSGEAVLISDASKAAQKAALDKQLQDDKSYLQSLANKPANIQALLEQSTNTQSYDGDRPANPAGGETVVVYGLANQLREAAQIEQRGQSSDNALSDYRLSYSLLSDDLKSQLPTPDSLQGKSLQEVQAALAQLNSLLATPKATRLIRTARLEPGGPKVSSQAIVPGNGSDNTGPCTPTNLYAKYWFPLKNFISPIKNQAKRGTCWAFTAIGAVESRERVQNNNPADLSEQFLVNKVKQDWDSSNYSDGYWSDKALEKAVDKGQNFPPESSWTYNPARGRPSVKDGDEDSYDHACDRGIKGDAPYQSYSGTCSNSAHQSRETCTTFIFTFCSYVKVIFSGSGVGSSRTVQIWKNGDNFDLNRYRLYLSQGYVIMASFPVYRGFMDDVGADGVVSNYSKTKLDDKGNEVSGSYGGHAVQIVGFLSNDDMATFNNTPKIGGGGYFIIKNSWGCVADGGYYYIPADYVSGIFNSLSVLNFDGRRSNAWNQEQAAPGGSEAPKIQLKSTSSIQLRVETNLAQFFSISHPVAKSINLTVTSSLDGVLYNGAWSTDPNSLFGPELKRTFTSVGSRTITLLAKYGTSQSSASFSLNVINTAPTITLQYGGSPNQGVAFPISAQIVDPNEPNLSNLCANTVWSVDSPDTLSATTGCAVSVTFGTTGNRQVRVSTKDSEGAPAINSAIINVSPPPQNPYPKITAYGVYSREFVGTQFKLCGSPAVGNGSTIDLRQTGCNFLITQPTPLRYFAGVTLENPTNETLTYDWKLYVGGNNTVLYSYTGSPTATYDLSAYGNTALSTDVCRVTLKVNAPDPTRSKGPFTVWQGQCTYYAYSLH